MKIGIQTCTCRRLRIQGFHGTYGAEGNFAKTKSKSEHCVLSMLKRKMKVEIVNCVLSEKKSESGNCFLSAEENPAFHEHSLVYQPYCR